MRGVRRRVGRTRNLRSGLLMDDRETLASQRDTLVWIRQSFSLAMLTSGFHFLQFISSTALWTVTNSAALAAFGLDALVSGAAALVLASRIHKSFDTLSDNWRSRGVGY